ncbi:MAG: hypothetical protein HYZ17_16455 [Betaproteobacteria bacterium]|nr:hypothetical protein [Betaproteobacteria bacterium]
MGKLLALLDLFRKGSMVADPALWKNRAALVLALSGVILAAAAVAKGYGYDFPVDEDSAMAIAGGIAAVVGLLGNYATSDKVGLPGLTAKPGTTLDVPAGGVGNESPSDQRNGPN